jgi:heme A synthase
MVGLIFFQILLGGLVASNFASLACTEFPACLGGQWFPTFSGMIGLHIIHRLGAYTVFCCALANWAIMRRFSASARLKKLSGILFLCVCGQLCLGVANVLFFTPPLIAVGHLALGVGVLSVAWRQLQAVVTSRPERSPSIMEFDSRPVVSYP